MAFQDFDQISQRREQERKQKLKKKITIGVSSVVVLLLIAGAAVGVVMMKNNKKESTPPAGKNTPKKAAPTAPKPVIATSEKVVKEVCAQTDYTKTCEDSLMKTVKSDAKPTDILKAAFSAASDEIDKVVKEASGLTFNTPLKKAAFDDCLVLLGDAKEELNSSISSIKEDDLSKLSLSDLNNWLSAVLSYQQACIDDFPEGEEKTSLQKLLQTSKELGGNALAILSEASSVLSMFGSSSAKRNLLSEDEEWVPKWVNEEYRRILKGGAPDFTPNATVAKDGSGNFTTVNAALSAIPATYEGRYVIYIKEGVYDESVTVTKKMVNITMYGDGSQKSVITGSKNFVDGVPTFQTATFAALGAGFMAQSIGFRNTAGPEKHQAVALRVQSDRSIFVNCRMEGFQDTLYAQTHRQFYRGCYITGTVDFIFGDAAAVFQNCMIYVRLPMENQQNIVTAQGRSDKRETTGIVLQNCRILADEKLEPEKSKFRSYLGRPWKEFSRTIVMETEIGDFIHPEGWMEWEGDFALKTLFYAEFDNKGPGASTTGRVKWPGYKVITKEEAVNFTVGPFLEGESWLKNPSVPVRFGMFA